MNKLTRRTAAAILALTLVAGAAPKNAVGGNIFKPSISASAAELTATLDEATGTLTLSGNVTKDDIQAFKENEAVKAVVCAEGTVLPADCSKLFCGYDFGTYKSGLYWKNLASVDLSNADVSNVTDMTYMFYDCEALTTLYLSGIDTGRVSDMSNMFGKCNALTSLDLSSFDTSRTEKMDSMFFECNSLTSLELGSFNTSSVKSMGAMFGFCTALTSLDLRSFDTNNVTSMYAMFYHCEKLETITVSDKWTIARVSDSSSMFDSCGALVGAKGTKFDPKNTGANYARIDNGESNPGYFTGAAATTVTLNKETGVLTLRGNVSKEEVQAFATDENVKSVVCATGTVLPADCSKMFFGFDSENKKFGVYWKNLEAIDLSKADMRKVTNMSCMFDDCEALEKLDLSNADTRKVTDMSNMFLSCKSLTELDLSSFDTSNVTTMEGMFYNCTGLKSLDLSSFDTSKVENTESMFCYASSLESIIVSDKWNMENVKISDFMFDGCTALSGGNGTAYDEEKINADYACVDQSEQKGYLTDKTIVKATAVINAIKAIGTVEYTDASKAKINAARAAYDALTSEEKAKVTNVDVLEKAEADYAELFRKATEKSVSFDTEAGILTLSGKVSADEIMELILGGAEIKSVFAKEGTVFPANSAGIFAELSDVTEIDLSNADMSKVTNMSGMFSGDAKLKTIIIAKNWDMSKVTDSADMFKGCTSLVGGNGTKLDSTKTDGTYACIDTAKTPGYFTAKTGAHEHTWGEWTVVKEATETETGLKKRVCETCSEEETEVIPVAEKTEAVVPEIGKVYKWGTMLDLRTNELYCQDDYYSPKNGGELICEAIHLDLLAYSEESNAWVIEKWFGLNAPAERHYEIPIGVKVVSGTGSFKDPLKFELVYDENVLPLEEVTVGKKWLIGDTISTDAYFSIETPVSNNNFKDSPDKEDEYILVNWGNHLLAKKLTACTDVEGTYNNGSTLISFADMTTSPLNKHNDEYYTDLGFKGTAKNVIGIEVTGGSGTNEDPFILAPITDKTVPVIKAIDAIGTVEYTDASKAKINAARAAYDALTSDEKAKVTNVDVLEKAEAAYAKLKAENEKSAADKSAAASVTEKINAISSAADTKSWINAVEDASAAYDALTESQQKLVTNTSVLTLAKSIYGEITKANENAEKSAEEAAAAKSAQEAAEKAKADAEADAAVQKKLADEAAKAQAAAEAAQKKAEEDLAAAQKELSAAQADLETAQKAVKDAENDKAAAETQAQAYKSLADEAVKAQAAAEKSLEAANEKLEAAEKAAETAQANVDALTAKLETAEKQIKELEAGSGADEVLKKQVEDLTNELEAAKEAQKTAEEAAKKAEADKTAAETQAAAYKALADDAVKAQAKAEKEAEEAKAAAEKAISEKEALEKELPQTGMSGIHKVVASLAAIMGITGFGLVKRSRKDDEEE